MGNPKMLSKYFFPGMPDQQVVGLEGVGVSVVTATLACNTSMTAAQLLAGPPNTNANVAACGPVVHSLGVPPTAVIPMLVGSSAQTGLGAVVQFQYCTADNSAVYLWAKTWTGTAPSGVAVRIIAIR